MFTRIIIVIDGDWKLLGILHSKPLQELHYEGSGTTTNYLHTIIYYKQWYIKHQMDENNLDTLPDGRQE